jgi:iron complex outermembrane receptor protein
MTFADRGRFPLLSENYSTKFQSSVANPDLKPEHSRNWDFGFSHAFGSKTFAQIEYFHNDMRNSIHSVNIVDTQNICPGSKVAGYCGKFVNIAKESHQGAEISVRSTPIARLTVDATYSYINRNLLYLFADNTDVSQVNTQIDLLNGLPKNKVIFNATGELPRKILAMATYRYEGGITLQDTSYSKIPAPTATSFGTVDIGTVIPVIAGLSFQTGIKNVLDRNYYYTPGYPEAGRSWYFNGRYKF